jgi:hypothetical protein
MSPPIRAGRAKLENVFQIRTPRGVLYGQISHESSGKSRLTRRKVYRYLGTYTPEFRNGRSDKKTRDDARKEELKKTTEEQRRKSILKKYREPRKQRPEKRDAGGGKYNTAYPVTNNKYLYYFSRKESGRFEHPDNYFYFCGLLKRIILKSNNELVW